VKYDLLLWGNNTYYKCLKTNCLGKYLDPRKDKVSKQFRILHSAELCDLYLGQWNLGSYNGLGMWLGWGRSGIHI
jgi:hypothetical protein